MQKFNEYQIVLLGNTVNYVEAGSGQPIIFMHNGGGFWQTWIKQIDYYSKNYQVFALDWPGFGESENPNELIALDLLTNTLTAFIQSKNLIQPILIGNCIGGSVALNYTIQNKNLVKSLILFNLCPGEKIYRKPLYSKIIRSIGKRKWTKKIMSSVFKFAFTKTPIKRNFPGVLFGDKILKTDFLYLKYIEKIKEKRQTEARVNIVFSVFSFSLKDILKSESFSDVKLIWGEKNLVTPLKTHGYYHKELLAPNEFEIIPNGSHLCMYEQPKLTNKIIDAYLATCKINEEINLNAQNSIAP